MNQETNTSGYSYTASMREPVLMSAHHRAYLAAVNLAEHEDKKFTLIYNNLENIEILKSLIQLFLCTKFGYNSRNSREMVAENVDFQLVEADNPSYNIVFKK